MAKELFFYKYQGAGNDFILFDGRHERVELTLEEIAFLCDRRFGIGADGLMVLQAINGYDFEMIYYNADGRLGSMCGNGGRCIVAFAYRLGLFTETTRFLAVDGPHYASIRKTGDWVRLQMKDVHHIESLGADWTLDTGSPHYVQLVENLQALDVTRAGQAIRYSVPFAQEGINVNFVEPMENGYSVRTYERGVEAETWACGTGVTAVAMAMAQRGNTYGSIETPIQVPGGKLHISFLRHEDGHFTEVFLEGPALFVFEGKLVLS